MAARLLCIGAASVVIGVTAFALASASGGPALALYTQKIVFVSNRDGDEEIFVMNMDGSAQTKLTSNGASDSQPQWSPDGSKIAFISDRDADYEIYVMNADGSSPVRLTETAGADSLPSWSPDGTQIIFTTLRDGDAEVYVMDADGSDETNVSNAPSSNDGIADWSPDGTRIAFMTDRDGDFEIYGMDPDGSNQSNITSNSSSSFDAFPRWSPNGSQIAFVTERDGDREVYTMDADGSDQTNISQNPDADDNTPAWHPNGLTIVYETVVETSPGFSNGEVFFMAAVNGANKTNLSNHPNGDGWPDWSDTSLVLTDADGDGCTNTQEQGTNPMTGGLRNPKFFWDFFDTPDENNARDGSVSGTDFFRVIARFAAVQAPPLTKIAALAQALTLPPAPPAYHAAFDRSFADSKISGSPDGAITGTDFFAMLQQFGNSCE